MACQQRRKKLELNGGGGITTSNTCAAAYAKGKGIDNRGYIHSTRHTPTSSIVDKQINKEGIQPEIGGKSNKNRQGEMAGDIRVLDETILSGSKRQRRHWSLQDRSTMSVNFLKANLAEEGCQEAQLDLAKKLLQDSYDQEEMDSVQKENSRLAVYWLIKSSEQGNEEATKLLKECLSTNHGITAQNLMDVRNCINTPINEKLTYKAAKYLYLALNNGEKFITTTQLLARIQKLFKGKIMEKETNQYSKPNIASSNDLGESTESTAAVLNATFTKEKNLEEPSDSESEQFQFYSSDGGEKLTLEDLLKSAAAFNAGQNPKPAINNCNKLMRRHKWNFFSQQNMFVLQMLIVFSVADAISLNYCVLLGASYISLWASFNLLVWRKIFNNFKDWSEAFNSVEHENRSWSDKESEDRLIFKCLMPYLAAVATSLVPILLVEGLSTLKIVVGCLVIYALYRGATSNKSPTFRLLGFLLILNASNSTNLLQEYVGPTFDLIGCLNNTCLSLSEFVNLNLPEEFSPLFEVKYLIPVVQIVAIISLLIGKRTATILQNRLPELLVALWSFKILNIFNGLDNSLDVGIGLLGSATVIALILIIQSNMNVWKMTVSLLLLTGLSFVFITFITSSVEENPFRIAMSTFRISNTAKGIDDIRQLPIIEWEEYNNACHRPAWKVHNPAHTQIKCFALYGKTPTAVRWKGVVSLVKVREIKQSMFPSIDDVTFDIMLNLSTEQDKDSPSWQNFLSGSDTKHPSPAMLIVSTTSIMVSSLKKKLIEYIPKLSRGDVIEFYGVLSPSTIGGLRPEVTNVSSIKCLQCALLETESDVLLHLRKMPQKQTYSKNPEQGENKVINNHVFASIFQRTGEFLSKACNTTMYFIENLLK